MRISQLIGRRVGILGFGVEGRSVLDALRRLGHWETVHVFSAGAISVPDGVELHADDSAAPPPLDVVVRSPGFAPHHPARRAVDSWQVEQTTATRLFLREMRASGLPVVGITGSKGKSTTSTLTYLTLQQAGVPVALVGNVGVAALTELPRILDEKLSVVMELSSYQCADLEAQYGPDIAGFLTLFPEHLDWHGSQEAYYQAKANILTSQRASDRARFNPCVATLAQEVGARAKDARAMNVPEALHFASGWFRRGTEPLFADQDMRLPGLHNRQNAVAALSLAELLGASPEDLRTVVESFTGLPFRLQDEGVHRGIRWFNDSISTAPETVIAALSALADTVSVTTLIVGGQRRGLDQSGLAASLVTSSVQTLIALPDTGRDVVSALGRLQHDIELLEADDLEGAVALARAHTTEGTACLFSPGAPSYHRYTSFHERGAHFRAQLAAL